MWGGEGQQRWKPIGGEIARPGEQHPIGMTTQATAWSLDPTHYAQIPHHQVDWATLAQQWIQMKGTSTQNQESASAPALYQQNLPNIQSSQVAHQQDVIGEAPMDLVDDHDTAPVSEPLYTRSSSIGTAGDSRNELEWSQPSFATNQMNQRTSEVQEVNQFDHHLWMQRHPSMDMSNFNERRYSDNFTLQRQNYHEEETYEEDLEAARRRALPSWIREGLEKVEREKRKAEEKERVALEREELRRRKRDQEQTELGKWAGSSLLSQPEPPNMTSEPVFDDGEGLSFKLKGTFRPIPPHQLSLEEILASLTKEEQMEEVMLSVRRQLTKILLEVTNNEMRLVAQEAIDRAKAKLKGLGDYGSDSEDQHNSDDEDAGDMEGNDADSDEDLMAEIERKKRNFEMKLLVEQKEEDEERDRKTSAKEPVSRSRSKSGETNGKYSAPSTVSNASIPENSREDAKREKPERGPSSRSQSLEKKPSSPSTSRRHSVSSHKKSRSRSRDRKRRRSRSQVRSRSRSCSRKSRSNTKTTKGKGRSPSSSKSKSDRIRWKKYQRQSRSRSSSATKHRRRSKSKDRERSRRDSYRSKSRSRSNDRRRKKSQRSRSRSRNKERKMRRISETSKGRRSTSSSSGSRHRARH